jgi:hypothetical protein
LFADLRTGMTAGAIAVALAIMSPAFRLITADVMLEGLGAALSCLCVYCYLRARETPERTLWWRLLALSLTALFFEKTNFWLLTVAPLALAFMFDEPGRIRTILVRLRDGAGALRGEWRTPLTAAAIVLAALVIAIGIHGPLSIQVLGHNVSLYPPGNLLTLAYALQFIRMAIAWRAHRDAFEETFGPRLMQLFYWHALPVTVSFLMPRRLLTFLWYVGPTHYHAPGYNPLQAARGQWSAFENGFHVAPWAAVLAAAGIALALLMLRRAGPPLRTVALVGLIGGAAVVLHPQQQFRFQTTILPPLWILAGAGWAMLLELSMSWLPRHAAGALMAAAVLALIIGQTGYPPSAMAYVSAIHPRQGTSDYAMHQAYRPHLDGSRRVAFIYSGGPSSFFKWTMIEHCKCRADVDQPPLRYGLNRAEMEAATASWLAGTRAELIVAIMEARPHERIGRAPGAMLGQFDALGAQSAFVKTQTLNVPDYAEITIWRRP